MNLQFDHSSCPNVYRCCSISITKSGNTYIIGISVLNQGTTDDQAWFTLWFQEPCTPPAPPPFNSNNRKALITLVGDGIGNGTNNVGPVFVPAGGSATTWVAWQPSPDVYDDTSIMAQVADQPNVQNAPLNPGSPTNAMQLVACADPLPAGLQYPAIRTLAHAVAAPATTAALPSASLESAMHAMTSAAQGAASAAQSAADAAKSLAHLALALASPGATSPQTQKQGNGTAAGGKAGAVDQPAKSRS